MGFSTALTQEQAINAKNLILLSMFNKYLCYLHEIYRIFKGSVESFMGLAKLKNLDKRFCVSMLVSIYFQTGSYF